MPLVATPLTLPPHVSELVAGDADGDGKDDLVAVSREPAGDAPDKVKLTVYRFGDAGLAGPATVVDLGNRPAIWDVKKGLWIVDREGIARVDPATGALARVAKLQTALASLGPATPLQGPVAHDLDGDGSPELVAWSGGRYHAFRADGTSLGSVAAPAEGALSVDWALGGAGVDATLRPPPLSVGDVDGDGKLDLMMPAGAKLQVYYTGDGVGARAATLKLPVDLEPPDPGPGQPRKDVSAVWLQDLDGVRKIDLVVQRTVTKGSYFGATTELLYARGSGTGFGAPASIGAPAAAFGVKLRDVEGDGDQDVVSPLVDVGMGNLARALVAQQVRVDLALYRFDGGQYAATPATLRTLSYFFGGERKLHAELAGDLDGDGRLDLVASEGEDKVRVFRGEAAGLAGTPAWELDVDIPPGDDALFVHDVTGDGKAEVLVWGRDTTGATLLRVTPR
ncbi:MAG: FG-GAP repeat domain-containing protein [Myxococcota bacterium]